MIMRDMRTRISPQRAWLCCTLGGSPGGGGGEGKGGEGRHGASAGGGRRSWVLVGAGRNLKAEEEKRDRTIQSYCVAYCNLILTFRILIILRQQCLRSLSTNLVKAEFLVFARHFCQSWDIPQGVPSRNILRLDLDAFNRFADIRFSASSLF